MKKYLLLISSAILFLGLSGCTNEGMEFDTNGGKGLSFVHFVGRTQTLAAKATAYTSAITVSSTEKSSVARTYNLIVDPSSTAIEGTHYTLSSKTITIPANEFSGSVILTANLDNLTPEIIAANFVLDSDEAIDYGKAFTVNMYLFFEVTMDWLVGTWVWQDYWEGDPDEVFEVEITRIDDNTIAIYDIWEAGETIEATVDYENGRILIKPNSKIWYYNSAYGWVYMTPLIEGVLNRDAPLVGSCFFDNRISIAPWRAMLWDSGMAFSGVFNSELTRP